MFIFAYAEKRIQRNLHDSVLWTAI